jgi:hypothetical protein
VGLAKLAERWASSERGRRSALIETG